MTDDEQQIGIQDKRQIDRWHLVYYLRVFESGSPSIFGHLVDLSERGLMLLCYNPVEVHRVFKLRMSQPNRMKDHEEIIFPATSKWCKNDADTEFYLAGFQLDAVEPALRQLITSLIRDFSQN